MWRTTLLYRATRALRGRKKGRRGRWLALAGALVVALSLSGDRGALAPGLAARKAPFNFRRFIRLREGTRFQVVTLRRGAALQIGSGRVLESTPWRLHFVFSIRPLVGPPVQGNIRIRFRRRLAERIILELRYKGRRGKKRERAHEMVKVDSFLADKGILVVRYLKGSRFLQLSRDSRGRNKVITEWGVGTLVPRR